MVNYQRSLKTKSKTSTEKVEKPKKVRSPEESIRILAREFDFPLAIIVLKDHYTAAWHDDKEVYHEISKK